jgi:DNA-binding transcriptional LysR family regulator
MKLMRTFVRVVEEGSFAAAASQLGVAPSIVSKQIAALERHLGGRLMNRTTRKMSMTEIGEHYFESCRNILASVDQVEEEVAALQGTARGHLKIRVPHSIGILHLGKLITEFCAAYPTISASISTDEFPLHALETERASDVVLHLGPVTSQTIATRELTQIIWLPYASPKYLKEFGEPETPTDLPRHNCLVHQTVFSDNRWHLRGPAGDIATTVAGSIAANSAMILTEAVQSGVGIALLPSFCTRPGIADGSLVRILKDYDGPQRNLYAAYPASRMVPRRLRLFIDYMVARLRTPPW